MSAERSIGLRSTLDAACDEAGVSLGAMTVLSPQNDPFRIDTPARHRDGEWLAVQVEKLGLGERIVHLRGLHYDLVTGQVTKPDGTRYSNTDPDWDWLQNKAAKAARWLGYLPWGQIKDARNSPPVLRPYLPEDAVPYLSVGIDVEIPDVDDLEPFICVEGFTGVQPYKLVLFGEKSSLEDVLAPIAESRKADLYLPTGEISDTFLHTMAETGAADGRPMIVFCVSDCDPSGWQMPISIGRKLQAFQASLFPEFTFQVHRVALDPDQVREYGLPSTPLKETEKRADKWMAAKGVEQTEVDALATLQPGVLETLVRQAIHPFFDASLDQRVREARDAWLEEAQARLDARTDEETLDLIRDEASDKLDGLRAEIDVLRESLQMAVPHDVDMPSIVIPEPNLNGHGNGLPLVDSEWAWEEQTLALKESKGY